MRIRLVFWVLGLACAGGCAVQAPNASTIVPPAAAVSASPQTQPTRDLDSIQAALDAQTDRWQSISYETQTSEDIEVTYQLFEAHLEVHQLIELQRDGSSWCKRVERKTDTVQRQFRGGAPSVSHVQHSWISDGKTTWIVSGNQVFMITPALEDWRFFGGVNALRELRQTYNCKALPDQMISGEDCYVVEAEKTRVLPLDRKEVIRYWFSKSLGMPVLILCVSEDSKNAHRTTFQNWRVNPTFPADRFHYAVPEGMVVHRVNL